MHFDVHGPDEPSFTAEDGIRHLSRADAIAEIKRCSFTTPGRINAQAVWEGGIGAEEDARSAVETIQKSVDRAWIDHAPWGQCLAVISDDSRVIYFDQVTPA
jgi:hypothetical protein